MENRTMYPESVAFRTSVANGAEWTYTPRPSKSSRRGPGNLNRKRTLPTPTDALPGTAAKVAVLIARVAARQQLWHPDDATL